MKMTRNIIISIIVLIVLLYASLEYLRHRNYKQRDLHKADSSMMNMIPTLVSLKEHGSETLYDLYKTSSGIFNSPFRPNNELWQRYGDDFRNCRISDEKLFNEMCGYEFVRDSQTGLLEMWDKYKPTVRIKEEKLDTQSGERFKKWGVAFKMYGISKNSKLLRKSWPDECFGD